MFGTFVPDPSSGRLPPDAHIGPVSVVLALGAGLFGLGMAISGSCISAHLYRLGEGAFASVFALLGVLLGFVLGFLSWNPLYLTLIADAPTIWLPGRLGYAGSLIVQLALGCTVGTLLSGIMAGALSGWIFALFCLAGLLAGLWLRRRLGWM